MRVSAARRLFIPATVRRSVGPSKVILMKLVSPTTRIWAAIRSRSSLTSSRISALWLGRCTVPRDLLPPGAVTL